jgi:hypothetical protein
MNSSYTTASDPDQAADREWETSRTRAWFPSLSVACTDRLVWRMGPPPTVLGPLAGARASMTTGRCRWTHRPCARTLVTAGTEAIGSTVRGMQQIIDAHHEMTNFNKFAAEVGILGR